MHDFGDHVSYIKLPFGGLCPLSLLAAFYAITMLLTSGNEIHRKDPELITAPVSLELSVIDGELELYSRGRALPHRPIIASEGAIKLHPQLGKSRTSPGN